MSALKHGQAWSMEEISMLADAAYMPKKRGSYKKRVAE
jgi:hypothetical protein